MSKFKTVPMINFCHNASSLIDLKIKLNGAIGMWSLKTYVDTMGLSQTSERTRKLAHEVFETFGLISTIVYKIL